jgi:hypothetical protein
MYQSERGFKMALRGVLTPTKFGDITATGAVDLSGASSVTFLEGTWTPVVADAASSGNVSPTSATSAIYTKIGRKASVSCSISNIDTTGMTGGNDLFIRGLPFPAISLTGTHFFTGQVIASNLTFSGQIAIAITDGNSYFKISEINSGSSVDYITISEISSGVTDLYINIEYTV